MFHSDLDDPVFPAAEAVFRGGFDGMDAVAGLHPLDQRLFAGVGEL